MEIGIDESPKLSQRNSGRIFVFRVLVSAAAFAFSLVLKLDQWGGIMFVDNEMQIQEYA